MSQLIAQCNSFFGCVSPPPGIAGPNGYGADIDVGPLLFANNILKLIIVVAGLYAFLNLIVAGYGFLGAGGDAKKVTQSWEKIWQSLLGLAFVAGSFVLAAIFGWLIFKNPRAILSPEIYGP